MMTADECAESLMKNEVLEFTWIIFGEVFTVPVTIKSWKLDQGVCTLEMEEATSEKERYSSYFNASLRWFVSLPTLVRRCGPTNFPQLKKRAE